MGDCLKRSFEAGLRWCGINDAVPSVVSSLDAQGLAQKYGLTYVEKGEIKASNEPAIVIYRDGFESTNSEYHAVFVSDLAPLSRWGIFAVIYGFCELRERTK